MSKFIEVKFKKPHPKYGYFPGDSGIISKKIVLSMLLDGYVRLEFKRIISRHFRSFCKFIGINRMKPGSPGDIKEKIR
jgi:hypothetical protein